MERAPDATELFYKGPHDSTATFEIGNPNLTIEGANTFEIGFKRAKGDFRFDLSVYRTNFTNFIYKRFTGAKCDSDFASCGTGTELDQIVYSQQDATFTGLELLTEYDVARIWHGVWGVEGQYDFVHALLADGTYVPKMPPHRLGGGVYYRDANWLARVNLLHAFAQDEFATLRYRRRRATTCSTPSSATPPSSSARPVWCRRSPSASGARTCSTTTSATASPTRRTRCCSPAPTCACSAP